MSRLFQWIGKEVSEMLPSVLFFFAVFNLMRWMENLFLAEEGIRLGSFVKATISAMIVGKVLLLADLLPVINAFRNKPLILGTLWKTLVYSLVAFLFRAGEHLLPVVRESGGLAAGFERLLAETHWPRFWASQSFLTMMLFMFVVSRELIGIVGRERTRRLFFGR